MQFLEFVEALGRCAHALRSVQGALALDRAGDGRSSPQLGALGGPGPPNLPPLDRSTSPRMRSADSPVPARTEQDERQEGGAEAEPAGAALLETAPAGEESAAPTDDSALGLPGGAAERSEPTQSLQARLGIDVTDGEFAQKPLHVKLRIAIDILAAVAGPERRRR